MMIPASDTSPLLHLAVIDRLDLLPGLFTRLYLPMAVVDELRADTDLPGAAALRPLLAVPWVEACPIEDPELVQSLRLRLGAGEAETIALALQLGLERVLMDDSGGRAAVQAFGLRPVGLLGVLVALKQRGVVGEVAPLVQLLREQARFYVSPAVELRLLASVGEA